MESAVGVPFTIRNDSLKKKKKERKENTFQSVIFQLTWCDVPLKHYDIAKNHYDCCDESICNVAIASQFESKISSSFPSWSESLSISLKLNENFSETNEPHPTNEKIDFVRFLSFSFVVSNVPFHLMAVFLLEVPRWNWIIFPFFFWFPIHFSIEENRIIFESFLPRLQKKSSKIRPKTTRDPNMKENKTDQSELQKKNQETLGTIKSIAVWKH